ncbi:hypothetical protein KI387_004589 [Taxus chinensis]|uniref:C2H2-type domain-containing protein n=1 Tax=Taxus chinensis TaxID=29808 RepID=A0AA38LI24_TAXCH|nr:hypothetical protein KI387_004589 [Taxus chinensis]
MAQAKLFVRGFFAFGVLILQLLGCLFVTALPVSKKRRSSDHKVSSWSSIKRFLTCKGDSNEVYDPQREVKESAKNKCYHNIGCYYCSGYLCNLRDIVHGNSKVMHRPETSPESSSRSSQEIVVSENSRVSMGSSTRSLASPKPAQFVVQEAQGSFRGVHLKKFSGCYECHVVVDPFESTSRDSSLRTTIYACPICGEIFSKSEALEQHQALKHAVSELAQDDSAKNIVDIIFQTSWLKKETPCKIDRILKVHNSQKTINKFEDYRDMVRAKANKLAKKHPRCIADGNELLRFHCTTLTCSLGMNGLCSLCNQPSCNVCTVIRHGFCSKLENGKGIYTTASSGKAHDSIELSEEDVSKARRAMLVCRVIAGRVNRSQDPDEFVNGGFDSVAGEAGVYSNLDELFVFNPKAVLPCFVVLYKA